MNLINRNKIILKKTFVFMTVILFSYSMSAQNCNNVEDDCPRPKQKNFSKSGMSHSCKIRSKQKKSFNLNLLEGKEYYISLCGESVVGNLQLRILSNDKKLMYDNAAAGLVDNFSIKAEVTQTIVIEVTAPLGTVAGDKIACLGVYVATKKNKK